MSNPRVGFVSLGCPKALVDSERIITRLRSEGYELSPDYADAGVVIINTCGFIESAIEESMESIEEAMAENGRVIVTGCLGHKADYIREYFPDVLHISGPQAYESVVNAVHEALPPTMDPFTSLVPPEGIKLTPRHYAYVKISEGCNHKCTFCIIPDLRGKLNSRSAADILAEATRLRDAGVKELLIISQDTSAYGVDLKYATSTYKDREYRARFADLCTALGELGLWVRLHYVYPYPHVDDVIPLMAEGKILPYLDIPLQHASPRILKLMKRPAAAENNLARIQAWRDVCPDLTIRSTFIVGFPGETDAEFEELLQFLDAAQIDRAGCFQYSAVEGARANELPDPVPEAVKEERYHRLMQQQQAISQQRLMRKLNRNIAVIIDHIDSERAIGRSEGDAPEIDGNVIVTNPRNLNVGDIIQVKITDVDSYDCWGVQI